MAQGKRGFGQITRLRSKRYQARYTAPDGNLYNGPTTFDTREDAEAWLVSERRSISAQTWTPPRKLRDLPQVESLAMYAEEWIRVRDLKPRTREHYQQLLDKHILPSLGSLPLKHITSDTVNDWYAALDKGKPTIRAHSYGLLRTILGTATQGGRLAHNPAHIRGAGNVKRARKIKPATLSELEQITAAMPAKYRPMVLLATWCALRFGEVAELRRSDLDLNAGVIHIRRGVVRTDAGRIVGTPKSEAGIRDVAVPPHLLQMLRDHLASMPMRGKDALLFPAADGVSHLAPSTLYRVFYPARQGAGRPDLRWHDLRHTGATLAAQTGATLAELMNRLGHATPAAALRYQHTAQGRDAQIAAKLSEMAGYENG